MRDVLEHKKQSFIIRTPDYRLRVFVSSTLKELEVERKAVRQAITKLRLAPVMFESGARPHPAQDLYQAYLTQSHVFIGIYWQSYGWIGPGMEISGLEDEYNRSEGMPRLIYIKKPAEEQSPALVRMLDRIREENASSYKYFSTPEELKKLVENDLILLLTEYFETARAEKQPAGDLISILPTNVPIPRNPLIGREQEMKVACDLLMREDVALVSLTGPAGTGKSRLGIQIALELRDHFSDGVYLVGLETIHDPGLVIPTIAKTLNIAESTGRLTLTELLKGYLCKKQILLLLDNFEQILPAAPLIADLLEACPKVKILVTSRAPLHLRAEKELPIYPLAVPPTDEKLEIESILNYSAIQLFIQRCQAIKPDFLITKENYSAIAKICERLDGLPLAIELASARIKLLPPQALLERLTRRFDLLRGGTKDLPERQRTMYSAIDWSYSLLVENEKCFFQRSSIFSGSFTAEAMTAVCGVDNTEQAGAFEILETLVDNNLIRLSEEPYGELRFRMLESIREFANEHLQQSSKADEVLTRFLNYYLEQAKRVEMELIQSSQHTWKQWVVYELGNLRAAMDRALKLRKNDVALQIAVSLWRFWWTHGYWSEGLQWLEKGLSSGEALPIILKAKALTRYGCIYFYKGEYCQAIRMLEESIELWKQTRDKIELGMAMSYLGAAILRQGDHIRARGLIEEALNLSREHGDKLGMYLSLEMLGHVVSSQGEVKKAIGLYTEALSLAEQVSDDDQIAKLLNALGDEYGLDGNYELAEKYFYRGEILCKINGNRIVNAYISGNRGMIAIKKGNYAHAFDLFTEAISELMDLGDKGSAIMCLEPIAYIAKEQGHLVRATRLLGAAEALYECIGMGRVSYMQEYYENNVAELTNMLGESVFGGAWAQGRLMSLDQAMAYAIRPGE